LDSVFTVLFIAELVLAAAACSFPCLFSFSLTSISLLSYPYLNGDSLLSFELVLFLESTLSSTFSIFLAFLIRSSAYSLLEYLLLLPLFFLLLVS